MTNLQTKSIYSIYIKSHGLKTIPSAYNSPIMLIHLFSIIFFYNTMYVKCAILIEHNMVASYQKLCFSIIVCQFLSVLKN